LLGLHFLENNELSALQYTDAVGLAWGADTMPVKQKHDHHGGRILRVLNRGEGNGKPRRLIYPKT